MKIKETPGERIFDIVNVILLLALVFVIVIPVWHVVCYSFSDANRVMATNGLLLLPEGFSLESYQAVARNPNIFTGYRNTIFIVIVGTLLSLLLTLMGAYVLSRKGFLWNRLLSLMVVFTMYFSGGMIPFYLTVRTVGLDGSIWSLIIPSAISTYNMIIMRTAMASVPASMEESATIDGAGHFRILFSIMIPLTKATLAVIALYYAVSNWNAWFNAMLFLRDKSLYPLQLILREILVQNDTTMMSAGMGEDQFLIGETIKYATIVVATVPILCVYPFLQKYFVKGVMIGAVKE